MFLKQKRPELLPGFPASGRLGTSKNESNRIALDSGFFVSRKQQFFAVLPPYRRFKKVLGAVELTQRNGTLSGLASRDTALQGN